MTTTTTTKENTNLPVFAETRHVLEAVAHEEMIVVDDLDRVEPGRRVIARHTLERARLGSIGEHGAALHHVADENEVVLALEMNNKHVVGVRAEQDELIVGGVELVEFERVVDADE